MEWIDIILHNELRTIALPDVALPQILLEELEREYGISDAVKLASNENPLGPSPLAIKAIEQAVQELHRYPNGASYHLCERLSKRFGVEKEKYSSTVGWDANHFEYSRR